MDVKSLEKEAYVATLRALHFQGGEATLEKEKFKIQLKKCLRISDETHLECLEKAMTEKKSRGGGEGGGKKAKAGGGYGSSEKQTKKRKSVDKASKKQQPAGAPQIDQYVGRKVQRYWPEDGGWVSGAISDFNAITGEHCIVYDMGTPDESWEWYNVRNASPDQCRLIEGEKIDLMKVGKAPGGAAGAQANESLETLEKLKEQYKAKQELIQAQLQQLESDNEDSGGDITYSDSD
eukprot:CAMPEP_0197486886 /NCGR_PEP_ID=MMETSP1311-20131121/1861_1 /TAXON_ID=464262 /ORGANISM="Genus nov. species nov., Strain RCC856" /LENGTH=234 /DNA_ID=CAMNT_0043030225 /DNA_START=102 /DNA_END=806 /DNA_ORIENTATION=+